MTEFAFPAAARTFEEQPITYSDLAVPFASAEKSRDQIRIGVEAEKFGILLPSCTPVPYEGERSILAILARLKDQGFAEQREKPGGPIVALTRDRASVTLEPGAQLELSGAPHETLHAASQEMERHHADLSAISADLGIAWCSVGFHPLAKQAELPWVPKIRYSIMREYLPTLGNGALDMMRRTATVQANFDYESEADAMRKLRLMLRLSPLVHAMTTNSPLYEGRLEPSNSLRGDVWTRMDKARSGLLERLWSDRELDYGDYIEWALDAGMFLFKRHDEVVANTGQSFRDFLRRGFQGNRATLSDWKLHLNTLFPEVRLKNTLEARCSDAQPLDTRMSVPALWTGLIYDARALERAEALAARYSYADVERARPLLIAEGLRAKLAGHGVTDLAAELLEIARGGLVTRARKNAAGQDESVHLKPLADLVLHGETPADRLRRRLYALPSFGPREIVEATRIA
ncbi:MAG: glutamate--cysteine ligase [Myxococcales bacterium]